MIELIDGVDTLLLNGDCLNVLKELEDNSVDCVITDPPYGLSFMGKKWDYDVPNIEVWKECLRVIKSGGHLLSFAGTRTYHKICSGIEDAGFEIRDMISWLYGSGFPKSLNIGKQIDKIQGNEREIIGVSNNEKDFRDVGKKVKEEIGIDKLSFGTIENAERKDLEITKGNSEWEGWGTALKPACEPIVVARKPLSERTVALNVLKWGTGGINIDDCRVGNEVTKTCMKDLSQAHGNQFGKAGIKYPTKYFKENTPGRFPANIILDEEAGQMLDEQSGISKSVSRKPRRAINENQNTYSSSKFGQQTGQEHNDKGGASRFFYCAKASKSERNEGMKDLEPKQMYKKDNSAQSLEIFGTTDGGRQPRKNNHPTVKPIKLMQYLIKLVTPKNGIVLDPFMGSGTTGIACVKLNRRFIGIEREIEYMKIAEARIEEAKR